MNTKARKYAALILRGIRCNRKEIRHILAQAGLNCKGLPKYKQEAYKHINSRWFA